MRRAKLESWLLAALLLGFAWRLVRYAVVFPMFGDEAFVAVSFQTRDLAGLLTPPLEHDMVVPSGFLILEWVFASLAGTSEAALRLLPWLFGLASFGLFARLARRWLSRHGALIAIAILAASYYPVRHAAEVKAYSADMLVGILLIAAAVRVQTSLRSRGAWLGLGGLAALAVWFSYPSIFVSGGAVLTLLWTAQRERDRVSATRALGVGLALVASFAAMYLTFGGGQQWGEENIVGSQWEDDFPPLDQPWLLPLWLVHQLTGNMLAYPNGSPDYGSSLTTALVIAGACSLWWRGRRGFVLLLLSPLPLMLLAAALRRYPFGGTARIYLHLAGPICWLAGEGAFALATRFWRPRRAALATRIFAALLLVLTVTMISRDLRKPYKTEGDQLNREFVQWLDAESGPTDRWVLWGTFGNPGVGPDLYLSRGSAARLRYYLLLQRGSRELSFGTPLEGLDPGGRTWLLAYRDNRSEFPEQDWARYALGAVERLGPAQTVEQSFSRKGAERVTVLRFE